MPKSRARFLFCCCTPLFEDNDHGPSTRETEMTNNDQPVEYNPNEYPNFVRESTVSRRSSTDDITLEQLQNQSPHIDPRLDRKIRQWEESYKKYEEIENKSLESLGPSLVKVLLQLRDDPNAFVNSTDPHIKQLAISRSSIASPQLDDFVGTSEHDLSEPARPTRRRSVELSEHNNPILFSTKSISRRGSAPDVSQIRPQSVAVFRNSTAPARLSSIEPAGDIDTVIRNAKEGAHMAFGNRRPASVAVSSKNANGIKGKQESGRIAPSSRLGTRELSLIWAGRLAEVSPTQGQLKQDIDINGEIRGLKITPRWPAWLTDSLYEVIKINKYGKRQRRVIKLTEFHILNIKNGNFVTKLIPYRNISGVNLVGTRDFQLFYEINSPKGEGTEKGVMNYQSLIASHIVQQLTTRTQVRRDLDQLEKKYGDSASSPSSSPSDCAASLERIGFSAGATHAMIEALSEFAIKDNSDIAQFALALGKRALEQLQPERLSSNSRSDSLSSDKSDLSDRITRLISISPESGEFRVKNKIFNIIHDVKTPEGNTLRHFLAKFPDAPEDSHMTELRHFIDGLYEYVVEHHVQSLVTLLNQFGEDESPDSRGKRDRSFSSVLFQPEDSSSHNSPDDVEVNEDVLTSVSYIAFSVVEETLFLSLREKILRYCLSNLVHENSEELLLRKMAVLATRTQEEFDIPEKHRSPSEWRVAIFELAGVERNPAPSMRLNAINRAARAIYTEYRTQVVPLQQHKALLSGSIDSFDSDAVLGADDFLPIFIFVFCRSQLQHPMQNKDLLWKMCHPDQLHGESGYYLTIYESAVEYVLSLENIVPGVDISSLPPDPDEKSIRPLSTPVANESLGKRIHRRFSSALS